VKPAAASQKVVSLIGMPAPGLAGGRSSWPRVLLGLGVIVVAIGVLGMHQLSLGHTLVTPTAQSAGAQQHASAPMDGSDTPESQLRAVFDVQAPFVGHDDEGGHEPQPCLAGCHDHQWMVATCVLALTLLVLTWRLSPPPLRDLPRFCARRSQVRIPLAGRLL
jgi:hypothetical protein